MQQHQTHLHARIDLLRRRAQRVGNGFGTDRIVSIGRILLAEQTAQALFDRVQILVAVFLQLAGDFADRQILGQHVLLDQAQLVERFRRGVGRSLQRLTAHAGIEIARKIVDEGLLDTGPVLAGLTAGEHVEVALVAVELGFCTRNQIFLDLGQHAVQRFAQTTQREIAAVVDHASAFGRQIGRHR